MPVTPPRPSQRVLPALAVLWSAVCAALGLRWLLDAGAYPLGPATADDPSSLIMAVPPGAVSVTFLALGVAGIPLALALGHTGAETPGRRQLLLAGAGYALVFGVLVPDVQLLAFLGYLTALASPLVVVVLLATGARRHPRNLIPLLVIGGAVAIGVLTGHIGEPTLEMFRSMREGFGRVGVRPLILVVAAAGGVLFTLLTVAAAGRVAPSTPESRARLQRWGRVATWVAAACPLPYALIRMTWLTPWPLGVPGGPEAIGGGVRVFGILLGLAALGGAVLTVGLVSRWGEVFPRWLPHLRGRRVPVMAAVIPATLVAAALCASSTSLVLMSRIDGAAWVIAAIPAPVWGPALGLATYAYYRRRTDLPVRGTEPVIGRA